MQGRRFVITSLNIRKLKNLKDSFIPSAINSNEIKIFELLNFHQNLYVFSINFIGQISRLKNFQINNHQIKDYLKISFKFLSKYFFFDLRPISRRVSRKIFSQYVLNALNSSKLLLQAELSGPRFLWSYPFLS